MRKVIRKEVKWRKKNQKKISLTCCWRNCCLSTKPAAKLSGESSLVREYLPTRCDNCPLCVCV